jgi:hypothetical protein
LITGSKEKGRAQLDAAETPHGHTTLKTPKEKGERDERCGLGGPLDRLSGCDAMSVMCGLRRKQRSGVRDVPFEPDGWMAWSRMEMCNGSTDPRCVCACVCERFTCGRDRSALHKIQARALMI